MSKTSEVELLQKLINVRTTIKNCSIYDAFNTQYKIYGVGLEEHTETPMIYYCRLYTNNMQTVKKYDQFYPCKLSNNYNEKLKNFKKNADTPIPDELYYHYKDPEKIYKIVNIGINDDNGEIQVIYEALYGEKLTWIRDLSVWNQKVCGIPRFIRMKTVANYTIGVLAVISIALILYGFGKWRGN